LNFKVKLGDIDDVNEYLSNIITKEKPKQIKVLATTFLGKVVSLEYP
jgi:hypothetical protein